MTFEETDNLYILNKDSLPAWFLKKDFKKALEKYITKKEEKLLLQAETSKRELNKLKNKKDKNKGPQNG